MQNNTMYRISEYESIRNKVRPEAPNSKRPSWSESFWGGVSNSNLTHDEWMDTRLPLNEWQRKHPDEDYSAWRRSLRQKSQKPQKSWNSLNWLQKLKRYM